MMMVSKLWDRCFPKFMPEHVYRHNFYLCQWQRNTQVRIIYLFYRWITAIACLAALVCSLLDIGRNDEHFEYHYAKWWIYLTHWGLLFCTVQAWLAAWIVTQGMMVERESFESVRRAKKSYLHRLYWVLYTCATVYSFIVTLCYWLLVYSPEIHKIDALNIMVHVFNSVIMLIDLAIVGHPIKLSHAYFTTGIGLFYAIFTGLYFVAGGTNRKNQNFIYPMLDWTKPGKAIIVTVAAIMFVFVTHFCCYLLYRTRVWIFTRLCIYNSRDYENDVNIGLNKESCNQLSGGNSEDYSHQQQYPITITNTGCGESTNPETTYKHRVTNPQITTSHSDSMAPQPSQYQLQYSGYQQQPVVAGVNVGVLSVKNYRECDYTDNNEMNVSPKLCYTPTPSYGTHNQKLWSTDGIKEYKM